MDDVESITVFDEFGHCQSSTRTESQFKVCCLGLTILSLFPPGLEVGHAPSVHFDDPQAFLVTSASGWLSCFIVISLLVSLTIFRILIKCDLC